jgi:hypothetical protein
MDQIGVNEMVYKHNIHNTKNFFQNLFCFNVLGREELHAHVA